MKTIHIIIITISSTLFCCSSNEKDLEGLYISKNNKNLFDTLVLMPKGRYTKVIYRKTDSSFIYKNIGYWEIKEGSLILNDFLVDNDQNFSPEMRNFEDILMPCNFQIDNNSDKIVIHHNQITDDIYYEKSN